MQEEGLQIATARFRGGTTDERDVEQAKTILASTKATIPQLEQQIEQTKNAIATLIGLPPGPLDDLLGNSKGIPLAPSQVAIGIPAELLRRRPDIRQAEAVAAEQSALIGVQKADLYPAFSLTGSFGFAASSWSQFNLTDIFQSRSRTFAFGPSFVWDFLNYGRIENAVRAQDAAFQAALTSYQNTVLVAQQEVENGLIGFRKQQERARFLSEAVRAAERSRPARDATVPERSHGLHHRADRRAAAAGTAGRAGDHGRGDPDQSGLRLSGARWRLAIREGKPFVPPQTVEAMAQRTNWGRLLAYEVKVPPVPVPRPELPRLPEP